MNNMACVPKAESGTKYPKMTTPQLRCFLHNSTNRVVLCPEGSFVKVFNPPPPCVRSTRWFCVLYITTLNCFEYSPQENCLGWIIWHFWAEMVPYLIFILRTFVLYTLMCLTCISRPFTVRNPPWKKRDILLGLCLDNMTLHNIQNINSIFEAHTESWQNLVAYIQQTCIRYWSDICVLYVWFCTMKTSGNLYYFLKSPSWPGMCICIDLSFLK